MKKIELKSLNVTSFVTNEAAVTGGVRHTIKVQTSCTDTGLNSNRRWC